jgi:glycosyltransferase involved in cell wall biosynthesis
MPPPQVSIIIANYNYSAFLRRSIQSALTQTYPNVEVIVVDDGSTDESVETAKEFAGRVKLLFLQHAGETAGRNAGFAESSGSIVAFLDADDYLKPEAVATVVEQWRPAYSKLQFHLAIVDERGTERGLLMPRPRLDSGRVDQLLLTTGRYITSPGSGNFYARWLLERIVPVPTDEWPQSFDSYAATYAGFYGEIGAIQAPLGYYRVHTSNMTRIAVRGKNSVDVSQLERLMSRGRRLRALIEKIASQLNLPVADGIVTSHWLYLKLELAHLKLQPQTDRRDIAKCALRMIASACRASELTAIRTAELIGWAICTAISPREAAEPLISISFDLAPQGWIWRVLRRL